MCQATLPDRHNIRHECAEEKASEKVRKSASEEGEVCIAISYIHPPSPPFSITFFIYLFIFVR